MTVEELIGHLKELPQDLQVITAKDAEGNGYNVLYYVPSVVYVDANEGKHGYIEAVYGDEDVTEDPDNPELEWGDLHYAGDMERRVVVG